MAILTTETRSDPPKSGVLGAKDAAVLAIFSLFYFADTLLRASAKYFWFDELMTVNVCRLPSFHEIQQAVLHDVDLNPPLFCVLTRLTGGPFGYGLISTRMPEIVGFWVLCVCLFYLVSKRFGTPSGFVAMLFPLLTVAKFYSYDARPHGIVLGCAGVAALAWQRAYDSPRAGWWLALLWMSLTTAFLTHVYAVTLCFPLGTAELYRSVRRRRIGWSVFGVMAASGIVAVPFILPLVRTYRKVIVNAGIHYFPPRLSSVTEFYVFLLESAILAILGFIIILAFATVFRRELDQDSSIPREDSLGDSCDLAIGVSFMALPVFGVGMAFLTHGPFIDRYSLAAVIGVAVAVGLASASASRHEWMPLCVACLVACILLIDTGRMVRHRVTGRGEVLEEPSSSLILGTTPGKPLDGHGALLANKENAPIVFLSALEYSYVYEYAPPEFRQRLWYVAFKEPDTLALLIEGARDYCGVRYQFARKEEFLKANPRFLLYGRPQSFFSSFSLSDKLSMRSVDMIHDASSDEHFLADIAVNP